MALKPIILYRNMRPVIFRKDGYSVIFPADALNRLYELAMGAEELNIEINAKLLVKNGEVMEALFPNLDKIVVIDTTLPFEIKANDRRYFDDTGDTIKVLREESYNPSTGVVDIDLAKRNLVKLKEVLVKYNAGFTYRNEGGSIESVYPENIDAMLGDPQSIVNFVRGLMGKSAYASEWFSSKPFRPFRMVDGKLVYVDKDENNVDFIPDEVIRLHNHPVGCPSPPSCWIRDNKIRGDVSEIFEGGTYGNLLNRGKGKWELVLFKEDDLTNLAKYMELFSDFWGWIRDRTKIADDIRKVALKPTVIEEQK